MPDFSSFASRPVHGWDGISLTAGSFRIGITPDIGGRIMSLMHENEELFFVQREHAGEMIDLSKSDDLDAMKRELGFRVWGGNKLWVAPQSAWSEGIPPLDLDAGPYGVRFLNGVVELSSVLCRETGLRVLRKISIPSEGTVSIEETLANDAERPARRGVWSVTQWLRPFDVYVPVERSAIHGCDVESSALYPSRVQQQGAWTRIACDRQEYFKLGGRIDRGEVIALRPTGEGTLVVRHTFDADPRSDFAHDASFEIYNSPRHPYLEIEAHAPLRTIAPKGSVSFRHSIEVWRSPRRLGPDEASKASRSRAAPTF